MKRKYRWIKTLVFFLVVVIAVFFGSTLVMKQLYPIQYQEYVEKHAAEQQLDPDLVYAVIKCESGFRPDAASDKDAKGLMQLTDDTFDWLKSKTKETLDSSALFDPKPTFVTAPCCYGFTSDEFDDLHPSTGSL